MTNRISPLSLNITYWLINLFLALNIYGVILFFKNIILPFLQLDFSEINHVARGKLIMNFVIFSLFSLILISGTFIIFFIFRKLIKNVKSGNPFTVNNISLLKKFSIGLFLLGIIGISHTLFAQLSATFEEAHIFYTKYIWYLIIAIIVWSLTHVFSIGLNLQKEKDLTI